jgi:glycosyltransferase involved in cell wall biosynthesis
VLFTRHDAGRQLYDPELGRDVTWGFDLVAGYPSATAPETGAPRWLARQIARRRPDLVIVNGYTHRYYLMAALGARLRGIPAALRTDSVLWPDEEAPKSSRRLLYRFVLSSVFRLFLTTGTLGRRFLTAAGLAPERIIEFPYTTDLERFREAHAIPANARRETRARLGIPETARVALAVAKMSAREAPRDLLTACAGAGLEDLYVLLVGDGPERNSLQVLAGEYAGRRAIFAGYVPYPDLPRMYAVADLFVHAAAEERWGVSVAEALAAGLPVVASHRVGSAYDLISPGKNGYIYRHRDAADLGESIQRTLELEKAGVEETNRAVLERFGYPAIWQSLVEGCVQAAHEKGNGTR